MSNLANKNIATILSNKLNNILKDNLKSLRKIRKPTRIAVVLTGELLSTLQLTGLTCATAEETDA